MNIFLYGAKISLKTCKMLKVIVQPNVRYSDQVLNLSAFSVALNYFKNKSILVNMLFYQHQYFYFFNTVCIPS